MINKMPYFIFPDTYFCYYCITKLKENIKEFFIYLWNVCARAKSSKKAILEYCLCVIGIQSFCIYSRTFETQIPAKFSKSAQESRREEANPECNVCSREVPQIIAVYLTRIGRRYSFAAWVSAYALEQTDQPSSSVSIYRARARNVLRSVLSPLLLRTHISKSGLQRKTERKPWNESRTREARGRAEWDIIFLVPGTWENRPDTKCMQRRVTSMYLSQ